jgi:peroxiredoxin
MPGKEKKRNKSWKERRHEKQIRQLRDEETVRIWKERETERKTRKHAHVRRIKGKLILTFCIIAVTVVAFGVWQYYNQLPPSIGTSEKDTSSTNDGIPGSAPDFSLKDINGSKYSLKQFSGKVIAIHFMAVGCGGQIRLITDHQLKELRSICNTCCNENRLTIYTIAVSTCEKNELEKIRSFYNITWIFGNDYEDKKLDIIDAYVKYSITDGTIVLIDKSFNVVKVYPEEIKSENLISTIRQLFEA